MIWSYKGLAGFILALTIECQWLGLDLPLRIFKLLCFWLAWPEPKQR